EADLAREEILDHTPANAGAQASALGRADGSTRARAMQQLQREHGNAYVQRVVARQRTAASGGPRVQRDKTPAPTPAVQPGGAPTNQPATKQTWLQPLPAKIPPIQFDPITSFQKLGATVTGHPYIGSLPTANKDEQDTILEANDYFERSP